MLGMHNLGPIQISIRTLIIAVGLIALAIAAVLQGGIVASVYVGVFCLGSTLGAITALIGVGRLRAMAIGSIVPIAIYFAALASIGASEFSGRASLPTSRLSNRLYDSISRPVYTDITTGKEVTGYDPATQPMSIGSGGGGMGGGMGSVALTAITPARDEFMMTCHVVWATLLALLGGIYGRFLHGSQLTRTDG